MRGDQLSRRWWIILAIEGSPNGLTVVEITDRENFNSAVVYPLAKKVFAKNFKRSPLAQSFTTI
jgi:hypothetical protein